MGCFIGSSTHSPAAFGRDQVGGPVVSVLAGDAIEVLHNTYPERVRLNPFSHAYGGFRVQHFSDAGLYGPSTLGVDTYILELGFRF